MVHWTEELFLEHADVWLEIHEREPVGAERRKLILVARPAARH